MLTEQQITDFHTFGFLIFRKLFSPEELETINAEFDYAMDASYRHAPFDGTCRHWVTMVGAETPFFASLLEDPRICTVAEKLYGEDVIGAVSDANRYVRESNWHRDTGNRHQYGVKFAYYLQPVGAESGALRVIPGSHKHPISDELGQYFSQSTLGIQDVPAYVCESEPGDVVAFDLRCYHASWGGSNDRRMCTVVYYNNPKSHDEEEATRVQVAGFATSGTPAGFNRPNDPFYDPSWIANSERSVKRQRWLDRMRELGCAI